MNPSTKKRLIAILAALVFVVSLASLGCDKLGLGGGDGGKTSTAQPAATTTATAQQDPQPARTPYDEALATPADFKSWCSNPAAAAQQVFVGDATGTTETVVAFVCPVGGKEFVALGTERARVLLGGTLIVAKGQRLEHLSGNNVSFVGPNNKAGAQNAKAAPNLPALMPGKTHIHVRIDDKLVIDLVNPLVVTLGDNGGDDFDLNCRKYIDKPADPEDHFAAELYKLCQKAKTPYNVGLTKYIVRYVERNPGVSRQDFARSMAELAKLRQDFDELQSRSAAPVLRPTLGN